MMGLRKQRSRAARALWTRAGQTLFAAALVTASLAACTEDGGDGGDFASVDADSLVITPNPISFASVELNKTATEVISIINSGSSPVNFEVQLAEDPTPQDRQREFAWADPSLVEGTITLGPGEDIQLPLDYTPSDVYLDTGKVIVTFGGQRIDVPITTPAIGPDIDASPPRVNFNRVPANETGTRNLTLQNVGQAPLVISRIYLGLEAAEFCFIQGSNCVDELTQELILEPFATVDLQLRYQPTTNGEDVTEVVVESNDPDEPTYRVEVIANGAEPCILVSDEGGVDFGTGFIGGVSSRTLTITNCSRSKALDLDEIVLTSDSASEFFLDGLPDIPTSLDIEQTTSFVVNYAPTSEAAHQGTIRIASSDTARSPLLIPVNGRGSNNACPEPIARAREAGTTSPWATELEVPPLATIAFDGTESFDPDNPNDPNAIAQYEWVIIERPTDSTAQLTPTNTVASPQLFMDLAGRYKVELRVYDSLGTPSCGVAEITIISVPQEDIHIQLVWETPGDPDETDTGFAAGTDIDLHFLHPRGSYNQRPYDCHWQNVEPDWGSPGGSDNPSLDIDDTDGAGPENINLNNPENVTYRVGVHYWDDHGYGPSYATVRIFLRQTLVFEFRDKYMERTGKFWDVGTIEWPAARVNQIDMMFDGFP